MEGMVRSRILIVLFIFISCVVKAQDVRIFGNVPDLEDSSEVWFSRPIDGNPDNYCFMYDNAIISNHKFKKFINIDAPYNVNIITIVPNKNLPKTYLICQRGDSIKITYKKNPEQKIEVSFEGSNFKGQLALNQSPLYFIPALRMLLDSVIKKSKSVKRAITDAETVKSKLFRPIDTLYSTGVISKTFHTLMQLECNSRFLFVMDIVIKDQLSKADIKN